MDTLKEHKRFLEQIDVCMSSDTMIFQRHLQAAPPPHTDLPPTPDRPNKRRIKHLANKQLGLGLRGSTHWQAQRLNKFLVAWWPPQTTALLSCDLVTGWDFRDPKLKSFSLNLLVVLEIMFVMLCPPCTMFSILQRLWNFKHWTQDEIDEKMSVAVAYVDHAMECAKTQVQHKHYFAFEHPHRSAAWDLESVSEVSSLDGVEIVNFDMCMLGLRSFNGIPMRKRTRLMTNVPGLVNALRGLYCDKCSHGAVHQLIQGSEGGMRRSVWSQQYPAGFADLVAREAARLKR